MSLPLTPALMESTYAWLLLTPPFSRWGMPECNTVQFIVTRSRKAHADHLLICGAHSIRMSSHSIKRTFALIETMAHEMVHIVCDRAGVKGEHGPAFRKRAALVCKHHGFDPGLF